MSGTYAQYGGQHSESASIRNVLAAAGRDHSEALVFGVAGGLGAGYILWEFQEHRIKVLVLGWQHKWNYPVEWCQKVCDRLAVKATFQEGVGKKGVKQLDDALDAGKFPIAWSDLAQLPHQQLPERYIAHFGTLIVVTQKDGGDYLIDDLAEAPFRISADTLSKARDRISSYKARLLLTEPAGTPDLKAAVRAGIHDCVGTLLAKSDSFALPAFQKWAKLMLHPKDKKSWLTVFAEPTGLFSTLASIYENTTLYSTDGGALRGLYAGFLREAASILGKPALNGIAEQYQALHRGWAALADHALPDSSDPLKQAKGLLRTKADAVRKGPAGSQQAAAAAAELEGLHQDLNRNFPLDDSRRRALFEALSAQIGDLYEAEVAAASALRDVMAD